MDEAVERSQMLASLMRQARELALERHEMPGSLSI